jgi:hypothetical protein
MGFCLFSLFLVSTLVYPSVSNAEEETAVKEEDVLPPLEYRTVTTPEGLSFRVPEDMPIEMRSGILSPIPFEEYVYAKFKQIDLKLKKISAQLDRIETLMLSLQETGKKDSTESISQAPRL